MKKIRVGDFLPDFTLKDQFGKRFDIKSIKGKKNLVIYFYPKNETPGCTKQACSFRDQYEDFKDIDAEVIGISGQSVESHKNFAQKHNLPYVLLSDENNEVRKKFGVPSDLFGLIPGRVTYVADKKGKVVYIFNSQFKVNLHVNKALSLLNKLN
jgi:peroxiredoxin Q/BCP